MGERILYLVRHGQLDMRAFAKDQIRAGLTARGREQVHWTAKYLASLDVSAIYCSTLGRALESAEIISKRFPDIAVRRSNLLRELPNLASANFAAGRQRGEKAFTRYARPSQQRQRIEILISHGNLIRYFVCRALRLPAESWTLLGSLHCGVTQMRITEETLQLVSYNQVTHLPERLRL
ncbi:MAG: histidine phosphatase family protein [Vicinamibacterales bacterium]